MCSKSSEPIVEPPKGWREKALISVAESRFSSVDKLTHGSEVPIRLCNYIDVYTHDYITGDLEFMRATATQPEIERFGLKLGDVIITKDSETPNDIGIPAVVDYTAPDLVCGYHLALLRPDQEQIDPTFFAKQLRHVRLARYFGQQSNGITRYGLPIHAVNNAPLWVPDLLDEQRGVGRVLRLMDQTIAKTEVVIAKLRQVRAGLLHDLLTRGLDKHGQLRDPTAHPEQFQDSPLGRIPHEWRVGTVLDLAKNRDARRIPLKQTDRDLRHGHYPYYGASGVIDYVDDYLFDGTFVLLGEDGENLRSRQSPLAFIASGKFWVNNHAHIFEPLPDTDVRFLARLLEAQDYVPWLLGSAQPKLTQRNLGFVQLRIPPPQEQKLISDILDAVDKDIDAEEREIGKLRQMSSGLTHDLLTGNVRVPEGI